MLLCASVMACDACSPPARQVDPGTEGNGVEEQREPYLVPPEASRLLADAPAGHLSPPALYESAVYPGWRFRYWLYVPAQYDSEVPTALMVFPDGGWRYIDVLQAPTVLDNLIHAGDIPVSIGLFIDPGTPHGLFIWEEDEHKEARSDRGYAYRYRPGSGAHYPPEQAIADFPDALRWLWRGYLPSR